MSGSVLMWEHHSWESPIRVGGRAFAEHFLAEGWKVAWLNGPLAVWNLVGGNEETRRRRAAWRSGGEDRAWGEGRLFTYAPLGPVAYRAYPVLSRPWFHRHSLDLTCPPCFASWRGEDSKKWNFFGWPPAVPSCRSSTGSDIAKASIA